MVDKSASGNHFAAPGHHPPRHRQSTACMPKNTEIASSDDEAKSVDSVGLQSKFLRGITRGGKSLSSKKEFDFESVDEKGKLKEQVAIQNEAELDKAVDMTITNMNY